MYMVPTSPDFLLDAKALTGTTRGQVSDVVITKTLSCFDSRICSQKNPKIDPSRIYLGGCFQNGGYYLSF